MTKPKSSKLPQIEAPACSAKFMPSMWEDPNYLAEYKLDGGRYLSYLEPENVSLISRERKINRIDNFQHIREYLRTKVAVYTLFDGEVCSDNFVSTLRVLNSSPRHAAEVQKEQGLARYFVFDIPFYNGTDLRLKPLLHRKQVLAEVLKKAPQFIQPLPFTIANKLDFYREYVKQGGEGVILKDIRLAFGLNWCKVKHRFDLSVIIIAIHQDRSAIEMGVYENGQLVRVGDCSTNKQMLRADLLINPQKYVGQVLDISTQGWQGSSLRSPTWERFRPEVDPKTITMQKLRHDLELGLTVQRLRLTPSPCAPEILGKRDTIIYFE